MKIMFQRTPSMSTSEMLRTLGNCRTSNPPKPEQEPPPEPINWRERNALKLNIFLTNLKILLILAASSMMFFVLPIWLGGGEKLGRPLLLSLPLMLFISLSWMVPSWKFRDRKSLLLSITLGMVPIRVMIAIGFMWMIVIAQPEINQIALFVGMMVHWILFAIPEFNMLCQLGSKLERTAEDEPV